MYFAFFTEEFIYKGTQISYSRQPLSDVDKCHGKGYGNTWNSRLKPYLPALDTSTMRETKDQFSVAFI